VFARTVASGFGTADIGGPWTTSIDASVSGGAARLRGAAGKNRAGYLARVDQQNVDLITDLSLDRRASGGGAYVSLIGRRTAAGTDYRLKLRSLPDGRVLAYIVRTLGGTDTVLAWKAVPGLTAAPGDVLRARLLIAGDTRTLLAAAVWRRDGLGPESWLLGVADNTPRALQSPGDVGVLLYTSASWSGTAPALSIDNFVVRGIPG
jgi:hypothetical protein